MSGILIHSPAHIIAKLLIDAAVTTDPTTNGSWPIHVGLEPENPDALVTIYDTSNRTQGRLQTSGETQEQHGILVRVRHQLHPTGWTKINAISNHFDTNVNLRTVTIDGTVYTVYAITKTSGPFSLGKEEGSNRRVFSLNSILTVRQN